MTARARTHTALFSLGILLVALPLWSGASSLLSSAATHSGSGPDPSSSIVVPVPADFDVKLLRAGLRSNALAAAGVQSPSVLGCLQAAADAINASPSALSAADAAYAQARTQADHLQALIQSGQGEPSDVTAYQTAATNLANATAQRDSLLTSYFNAAANTLTAAQRSALTKIQANRSWELPVEFLVVERSQAEWVKLRDALANERIALELPDTLSPSCQASLTTWRADPAVASAKASLDSNLASVSAAWNTAAGD